MSFLDLLFNEKTIFLLMIISIISATGALILSFIENKPSLKNIYRKKEKYLQNQEESTKIKISLQELQQKLQQELRQELQQELRQEAQQAPQQEPQQDLQKKDDIKPDPDLSPRSFGYTITSNSISGPRTSKNASFARYRRQERNRKYVIHNGMGVYVEKKGTGEEKESRKES